MPKWLNSKPSLALISTPWMPSGLLRMKLSPRKLMTQPLSCRIFALTCPRLTSTLLFRKLWPPPCPVLSRLLCPPFCLIHRLFPVLCAKTGSFDFILVCCRRLCCALGSTLAFPCRFFTVFCFASPFRSCIAFGILRVSLFTRFILCVSLFSCRLAVAWSLCFVLFLGTGLGIRALRSAFSSWLRQSLAFWIAPWFLASLSGPKVLLLRPSVAFVVALLLPWISPMLGASFSDPAPDLSFEPLPNLGNTCWLASVTRLLHTCDLRLPCAMPSWRETVDHMSALGFHDGGQKDPRVFLAAICALYPQWTQDSLWSFNRTASCSVCLSARLIPSDGQFVVDLGLPSDLPTSVSDLISDVSSPVDSHLDCVTCGRVRHVLGSPSPAAHLPFVLFHIRRAVGGVKSRSIVRVPNRVSWFGRIYQLAAATIHIGAVPETASVTLWLLLSIAIGICNRMLPCWLTSLFLIVLLCLVTRCRSLFLVIRLPAVPCSLWLPILLAGFLVGLNF